MSDKKDSLEKNREISGLESKSEPSRSIQEDSRVRFVSFNILHGCESNADRHKGSVNFPALINDIAGLNPDVLGLQEVDRFMWRTLFRDISKRISKRCGFDHRFSLAKRWHGFGQYGISLFTVAPMTVSFTQRLPRRNKRWERRVVSAADVELNGRIWRVANTHLSFQKLETAEQLNDALDCFKNHSGPAVLMGDMNMRPDVLLPLVEARGWKAADSSNTYPSWGPEIRIDYVLMRDCHAVSVEVRPLSVSDHASLIVDVVADGAE